MVSKTLSHYKIIEKIGAEDMGKVYRARNKRLDRDVALKLLSPDTLSDKGARKRFRKEAMILSRLDHPHIAIVYDFDMPDGVPCRKRDQPARNPNSRGLGSSPLPEGGPTET